MEDRKGRDDDTGGRRGEERKSRGDEEKGRDRGGKEKEFSPDDRRIRGASRGMLLEIPSSVHPG